MSERGVFAVDRGVFDHPMFAPEPFTEREAWMWLVGLAAYRACQRRIGSAVVELKRGQAAASVRYLADKWQWKAPRVQRFLARLKKEGMIDTAADTGVTVISINNYSKYQKVALPTDTPNEQAGDTAAIQQRYKEERNKTNKQDSEEPSGSSADAEPVGEDDKTRLFRIGKTILVSFGVAEKRTGSLLSQWLKQRPDPIGLLAAIQYARDQNVAEPVAYVSTLVHGKENRNGHHGPRTNLSDLAFELAAEARERERQAGIG